MSVPVILAVLAASLAGVACVAATSPALHVDGLYHGTGRPIRAVVEGEPSATLTLRLLAINGDLKASVPMPPGKSIDLAAAMPMLNQIEVAHWLQLTNGDEPLGTPWVAQPLISRPLVRTASAIRADGTTKYTRVIGWGERLLEPENTEYVELKKTWPKPDPTPRSGVRIYVDRDVILHTDKGDIRVALAPDRAPNTAWNFRALAEGGIYDHTPFHRVVRFDREGRPFVIQGGDPTGTGDGTAGYDLPLEPSDLPHEFGVLSMARNDTPDSAGSQFFFGLSREGTARLDNQYCAFGWAVSGADVIIAIADGEIADLATGRPKEPVIVREAELRSGAAAHPRQGKARRASDNADGEADRREAPGARSLKRRPLWNAGFLSLFATQFFEAASDNIIKGAIGYAVALGGPWADRFGAGGQGLVSFLFTVPFVILSAFGGRLADRFSKRSSTIALKSVSIGVALATLVAFRADSIALAVAALVLFASVSSFFGPVKYGMIAELVERDQIVRANGLINVGTNLAVITGTVLAGVVATSFASAHADSSKSIGFWLPGLVMLTFAVLGLLTCLTLPKLTAQSPDLPLDLNPFSTYWEALRGMAKGPLIAIALLWTFFYFLAAIVIAILADYPKLLGITPLKASLLSGVMGVAIGIGCIAAAWLCGKRSRLGFVPFGAAGLAVSFLALGVAPLTFWIVGALLFAMGIVAGFYIIPLQAALQELAPSNERGRFLGTANAMSFVMGGIGSLLFWSLGHAGVPANRMFIVLAALTCVVSAIVFVWLRRNKALLATATLAAPNIDRSDMTDAKTYPTATIETDHGVFTVELWNDVAPKHAESFLKLTRKGYYDNLTFHRVIPGFVIQGGCPKGDGTGGPGWTVNAEFNDRKHEPGVLSAARSAHKDSAGSQFFVCLTRESCKHLDNEYTAFGKVTSGMDVVNKIAATPLKDRNSGTPAKAPKMIKVTAA